MKFVLKILLFVIFSTTQAYACALCALYTPTAHVSISFKTDETNISSLNITWLFSENFTSSLLEGYDENADKVFDENELIEIQQILLDYIKPKNYLTELSFYDLPEGETKQIAIQPEKFITKVNKNQLIFKYEIPIFLPIQEKRVLRLFMEDDEGFFNFKFDNLENVKLKPNLWLIPNANLNTAYFEISNKLIIHKKPKSLDKVSNLSTQEENLGFFAQVVSDFLEKLKSLLYDSANKNSPKTAFTLIFISFIYGFLHAAGPGHGKTLTGSYFLATGGDWQKALLMSLRIGFIHVIGAVTLVAFSMFVIQSFISKIVSDVTAISIKFAAFVIVAISFIMLVQKIKSIKNNHPQSCSCSHCNSSSGKKEWFLSFAAGIVPCPGTIVIFILTFTIGSYLAGFLSAISMSLGMSFVIFLTGITSQFFHNNFVQNMGKLRNFGEIIAILLMMSLGVLTYISAQYVL